MNGLNNERVTIKPEALIRYEQCISMGIPLVAGGLMDQPYIWLQEWKIVADVKAVFDMIRMRNAEMSKSRRD
jgi:hypothetical protein